MITNFTPRPRVLRSGESGVCPTDETGAIVLWYVPEFGSCRVQARTFGTVWPTDLVLTVRTSVDGATFADLSPTVTINSLSPSGVFSIIASRYVAIVVTTPKSSGTDRISVECLGSSLIQP